MVAKEITATNLKWMWEIEKNWMVVINLLTPSCLNHKVSKWPSIKSLIHFYKRCVSSSATDIVRNWSFLLQVWWKATKQSKTNGCQKNHGNHSKVNVGYSKNWMVAKIITATILKWMCKNWMVGKIKMPTIRNWNKNAHHSKLNWGYSKTLMDSQVNGEPGQVPIWSQASEPFLPHS